MRAQVIEPSSTLSGEKKDGGGEALLELARPALPALCFGGVALIKGCCQKQIESRFALYTDDALNLNPGRVRVR